MQADLYAGPTVPSLLLRAIRTHHDKPAFVSEEATIRYGDIGAFMGRAQGELAAAGFKAGDCIAFLSKNGAEAWMIGLAAQAMGCIVTSLHVMGSLSDHLRQLAASKARGLVIDVTGYETRGAEIHAAAPDCRMFTLGRADYAPDLLVRINAAGCRTPHDISRLDAVALRNYTGGTTGVPKAVAMRHGALCAGLYSVLTNFELPWVPRVLAPGPVSHVTGCLLMPTLLRGGSIHMLPGFDLELMFRTIERARINTALMIPIMVYMLLDSPTMAKTDMSSVETILYGGSPMSPARLVEAIDRLGSVFAQFYGQSECFPITYLPKADHDPARPELFASCGYPVLECETQLLDLKGQPVSLGAPGEICVRGAHVFEGYESNEQESAAALRDGWLHTGDVARTDEAGRYYILDRKKDMIVTGGFNVFPREVEDAIATHAGIAASAVIGVPDDRWGEAVCAYVVARPGAELSAEAIIATVKSLKGSVHAPKIVHIVDRLPLTAVGKVDKKPLRDAAWANAARRVN